MAFTMYAQREALASENIDKMQANYLCCHEGKEVSIPTWLTNADNSVLGTWCRK
jgi:hypothetical protein